MRTWTLLGQGPGNTPMVGGPELAEGERVEASEGGTQDLHDRIERLQAALITAAGALDSSRVGPALVEACTTVIDEEDRKRIMEGAPVLDRAAAQQELGL